MPTPAPELPPIYFGDKYSKGANTLKEEPPPLMSSPFWDAFKTHHPDDAHFVTYRLYCPEGPELIMPRLTKMITPHVFNAGGRITSTCMVLDWDTPGHVPLTAETFGGFFASLLDAAASLPLAMAWTLLYSTRNGARLVYRLAQEIAVEEAEGRLRGLIGMFRSRGIQIDESAADWTRFFRLPYVTRDRTPTWLDSSPAVEFIEQPDNVLDALALPSIGPGIVVPAHTGEVKPFTDPIPDYAESMALRTVPGSMKQSDFMVQARKALRGRECFPSLFESAPFAEVGERDQTIMRYVGQAISLLYHYPLTTPQRIYSLFLPVLEQLDPDQGTRSWLVKGWDAIGRLWSQEAAKEGGQVIREAQEADAAKSLMVQLHEKITAWPGMDGAIKQPGFLVRHLIASTGGSQGLYVMSTDPADGMGYYRKHPVSPQNLIATIRNSQLTGLIPTTLPVKKGVDTIPDRTAQSIINEHATIVKEVWIEPGLGHGGYISDIDKSGATLHIKAFSRNQELEDQAEPCTAVDEWLRAFFGVDYKIGCAWIAYSLAVEEGAICALSLKGKAGSGKKLLTQGLAECLQNPDTANGKDLVGDFNPGLLNSPFLVINEGWPASGRSAMHPADQFRSLVSGDPISVNQKFMAPVRVTCGVRIIITANNHGVVRNLTHGRDLSPEDREALACRLLHINIGEGAAAWLHDRGGMALTGKPGARWIRGDGGQLSNHILAKHFLWMYLNRHKHGEPGSRFLVTGNASKDILFELRTATGNSPLVIECLISMLESPGQRFSGLSVDDHGGTRAPRLFVLPSEILDYYRSNMRDRIGDKLTIAHVTSALQGLAVREAGESFVLPSRPEMGTKRWWEVDVWTLLEVAKKDGWKSPKLAGIVGAQQAERGAMQLLGTEAVT